ncbi:MAG: hemerythrin domain-containing protein [Sandaracinus sp.]
MSVLLRPKPAPGAAPSETVVSRLADCHARIRRFLAEARALATGVGSQEARRASAVGVARYFSEALPLHAEDEDRRIAPHLPALAALHARLAREHEAIEADLALLAPTWAAWARGETAPPDAEHAAIVERLASGLEAHLTLEERELFPHLAALAPDLDAEVVRAMIARRTR